MGVSARSQIGTTTLSSFPLCTKRGTFLTLGCHGLVRLGAPRRTAKAAYERAFASWDHVTVRIGWDYTRISQTKGLPETWDWQAEAKICLGAGPRNRSAQACSIRDMPDMPVGLRLSATGISHAATPGIKSRGIAARLRLAIFASGKRHLRGVPFVAHLYTASRSTGFPVSSVSHCAILVPPPRPARKSA